MYIHIFDSTVIRQTNNKNSTASTVSHILVTNKQIKTCIENFQKKKKKKAKHLLTFTEELER